MRVLCIGDVVGSAGCNFLRSKLPRLKRELNADVVIVNGENSADGNGLTPETAEHIYASGADVITTGNHVFRQRSIFPALDSDEFLLRPANYPPSAPGKGYCLVDLGRVRLAVINLLGTVFMDSLDCPFKTADALLERAKNDGVKIVIIDMHAEATAEKKALAFYLDGRVSAVFGTHTHVQTADAQVLPAGTGFITDVGMTGPFVSVLGVKPEQSIARMKDKVPVRFQNADGKCILGGALFDIDEKSGLCRSAEPVRVF